MSPRLAPGYEVTVAYEGVRRRLPCVSVNDVELDPGLFNATVTSLTHSFGDRTRRAIYLYLRENPGATAAELAQHCDVHANVVRHHLERLAEGGYVTYDNLRRATVGRPAKGYRIIDTSPAMETVVRRDALLVALLERAFNRLGADEAERVAHEVGLDYGRGLGASSSSEESGRPVRAALASIAGLLSAHGFAAHAEHAETGAAVVSENCPFGLAAREHPVLCAVDRGLITGMLEGVGSARTAVTLSSRALGDDACRHRLN